MAIIEAIFGLIMSFGGLYITLKESVPYERGFLPNILCGFGVILVLDGISKFFKSH